MIKLVNVAIVQAKGRTVLIAYDSSNSNNLNDAIAYTFSIENGNSEELCDFMDENYIGDVARDIPLENVEFVQPEEFNCFYCYEV